MNFKHLATNFNINAILDKSEPERKTILDKMVVEKKETERLLEKFGNIWSKESVDVLNEKLQVLESKIEQVRKTLPLSFLATDCLLKLGDVFPVTHRVNGKTIKSLSLLVTEAGVKSCGFDLAEIFKHCPNNKTWQVAKPGHIVDIDLYQQLALAEAFVLKYPELKTNFGFYNLLGSKDVSGVLKDKVDTDIITWFFTGERFDEREYAALGDDNEYEESKQRSTAGLVTFSAVKKGTDSNSPFCFRGVDNDDWNFNNPDVHYDDMPVVLGLIIE